MLKIAHLWKKILLISVNLNFTPNSLGCYGLIEDENLLDVIISEAYISL